jgi:arginine:pyruvate transaminase
LKYSSLTSRIDGESVDTWAVHYEAAARRRRGEDIILLSVGQENQELTPAPVCDAAIEAIRGGNHYYTPVTGEWELREAVAARHQANTGQPVSADNVAIFSGAQNALFATSECLLEHGDEVIVPEPYYATYPATFSCGGAQLVPLRTKREGGFQVTPEAVEALCTDRTRALVLNSPNNPTGAIYPRDALQHLVEICRARGIWIISDEVYAEIAPPEVFCSVCSLPAADDMTVTISSLSKSHRMTGWRCGWAVGPRTLVEHFYNFNMFMCYGLPGFIQAAALRALQGDIDLSRQIRGNMERRRALITRELAGLEGASLYSAGGGMFVVLDVRPLGVSGLDFAWSLLDRHRVGVLPCDGFGESGRGLLRISLCESDERIVLASQRLRAQIGEYRAGAPAEC